MLEEQSLATFFLIAFVPSFHAIISVNCSIKNVMTASILRFCFHRHYMQAELKLIFSAQIIAY